MTQDYDPRRGMCDQGQHARCANAAGSCPCRCHLFTSDGQCRNCGEPWTFHPASGLFVCLQCEPQPVEAQCAP